MNDDSLHSKLDSLPKNLKKEAADFVDYLLFKEKQNQLTKNNREPGLAKNLIEINENFDDPIDEFDEYMQ
jgi:hypothetical protein